MEIKLLVLLVVFCRGWTFFVSQQASFTCEIEHHVHHRSLTSCSTPQQCQISYFYFCEQNNLLYLQSADEEVHAQTPYDFAIILGGTNDLCRKSLPNEIYQAFQKVWSIPLSQATKVLALTIPEIGYCSVTLAKRREKLNTLILNHQEENL